MAYHLPRRVRRHGRRGTVTHSPKLALAVVEGTQSFGGPRSAGVLKQPTVVALSTLFMRRCLCSGASCLRLTATPLRKPRVTHSACRQSPRAQSPLDAQPSPEHERLPYGGRGGTPARLRRAGNPRCRGCCASALEKLGEASQGGRRGRKLGGDVAGSRMSATRGARRGPGTRAHRQAFVTLVPWCSHILLSRPRGRRRSPARFPGGTRLVSRARLHAAS